MVGGAVPVSGLHLTPAGDRTQEQPVAVAWITLLASEVTWVNGVRRLKRDNIGAKHHRYSHRCWAVTALSKVELEISISAYRKYNPMCT